MVCLIVFACVCTVYVCVLRLPRNSQQHSGGDPATPGRTSDPLESTKCCACHANHSGPPSAAPAMQVTEVECGWQFVGGNLLVEVCWWQLVGGSLWVAVGWWQFVGGSLLVTLAVCGWQFVGGNWLVAVCW